MCHRESRLKRNPDLVKDTIESLEVKPDIHMSEPSQRDLLLNKLSDETNSTMSSSKCDVNAIYRLIFI